MLIREIKLRQVIKEELSLYLMEMPEIDEQEFILLEPESMISVDMLMGILDEVFQETIDEDSGMDRKRLGQMCKQIGLISMADAQARVLRGVNQSVLAADGKLLGDKK